MGIQIGAKLDSGFDDPLGMLKDCHRRIEHFLNILHVVVKRAGGRGLSEEESAAVHAALHYFREGGRRHTTDEEESLFPRLRAACGGEELAELGGLEDDHREADRAHALVDELYTHWLDEGTVDPHDLQRLENAMDRLVQLYGAHIALEDNVLFPRAAHRLSPGELGEIGQEFRARRT